MTVKPSDAEELITAADYDKVMEYLQGTPRTNKLKILERVALFSLEIIKLHNEKTLKKPMESANPIKMATDPPLRKVGLLADVVPTKKRSSRPCKVDDDQYYEEPSLKKHKSKEYHHPESSNEKKVTSNCDLYENPNHASTSTDPTPVVVEEEEKIKDEEWHPEESTSKNDKRKKKAGSRVRNPNPRNPNPINGRPVSREIPIFLSEMMERMKGSESVLVIEKVLTNSDMNRNLSRLQMPESQMNVFLREEEVEYLKMKEGSKMNGIEALLHQRGGEVSSKVTLRRWKMLKGKKSGSIVFVLASGWNDFVARNNLNTGDTIQLWSFRVDNHLHFSLLRL